MPPIGSMRDRVSFQRRTEIDDGYGNQVSGPWTEQFVRSAEIKPSAGIETVIAARLQGVDTVTITVRYDSKTKTVTSDWRAVDARDGTIYAIQSASDLQRRKEWWTMTAQSGVAA